MSSLYPEIYAVINAVPRGAVISYGEVAKIVGCGPRQVGQALRALPKGTSLPWHRVISSAGKISLRPGSGYEVQRTLLEQEEVEFNLKGRVDMKRFGWRG